MTTQFEQELLAKKGRLEKDLAIIVAVLKTYRSYSLDAEAQDIKSELLAIGAELEALAKTCPRCRKSYNGDPAKSEKVPEKKICLDCKIDEKVMILGYDSEVEPEYLREFEGRIKS